MKVTKNKKGALKFHWKPSKRLDSVYEYLTRGFKVEAFSKSKGWHLRKRQPKRDNPVAILRDLFIRAGRYPEDAEERASWDKTLGDLYLYAEEKVDGIFVDERIPLRQEGGIVPVPEHRLLPGQGESIMPRSMMGKGTSAQVVVIKVFSAAEFKRIHKKLPKILMQILGKEFKRRKK